jgi:NADH-quinone oxidoreductase subunit L
VSLNPTLLLAIPLLPLAAAIIAGLFGRWIGRTAAHVVTILGVTVSCLLSMLVFKQHVFDGAPVFNEAVYTWLVSDGIRMEIGFLIDSLTVMMMVVVTFVSLCVHVYTIGYMHEDPGYQRFFSYISLFTFAMLMLVMSNNFLQLFFGWEAVGVVSYLLIGFWYTKPTAIFANMKAFLVNRVGDFGFLLGIAGIVYFTGSLQYTDAFAAVDKMAAASFEIFGGHLWNALTVICICLFIGAMGKSAQMPLHVWLPDSMEGPTPISALIHAATMVTAGIFMVARMSPLFEGSDAALSFIIFVGASTALFMGFLGIIQNDIKRVVAYSTLSQLGYMTVALGVSAYSAGVFHLMTHAFFKALLFLGAGSVIIGMHHDQDIRNMGGLRKYMPITWITSLIGSLALIGTPFFSGFYSKDSIILAVEHSEFGWVSTYATFAVLAGVFVTAFYSFRMYFLVFHGKERFRHKPFPGEHDHADEHGHAHVHVPHESPAVVWAPLVALAIPSVVIGFIAIGPMLAGGFFDGAIFIDAEKHPAMHHVAEHAAHAGEMGLHAIMTPPFWLALAGVVAAWFLYLKRPELADSIGSRLVPLRKLLENKYYFDWFNENVLARVSRGLGLVLWNVGDKAIIDGAVVNGSAYTVGWLAGIVRRVQTGFLYTYAFWMVIGLALLLGWFLVGAR